MLAGLLAWEPFMVDVVGSGNTNPPSVARLDLEGCSYRKSPI